MIRPIALALILAAAITFSPEAPAQSISMASTVEAGVPMKVIDVNLNNTSIKVTAQMPKFGAGHAEPFGQMLRRTHPTLALTGTFFCTHSLKPIGDIVIDGQLAHFGGLGTAFCVTDNNEVEFIRPRHYTHQDWSKFDLVVCSGPRLITGGTAYVEPWSEGFHDHHMLNRNGRLAIGITKYNHLFIVATRRPVYLSKLARAMRALGVVNAINLDAGSSMGLFYKGKTVIKPARRLTNLILVYDNRDRYEDLKMGLLSNRASAASQAPRRQDTAPPPQTAPGASSAPTSNPSGEAREAEK